MRGGWLAVGLVVLILGGIRPAVAASSRVPKPVPFLAIREQSPAGWVLILPEGCTTRLFRLDGDRWVLDFAGARWPVGQSAADRTRAGMRIRTGAWRPDVARLVLTGQGPRPPSWRVEHVGGRRVGRLTWGASPLPSPSSSPPEAAVKVEPPALAVSASPDPASSASELVAREGRDEVRVAPSPGVTLRRAGPLWLVRLTADATTRFRLSRRGQRSRLHVTLEGGKLPPGGEQAFADGPFALRVEPASGSVPGAHVVLQWPLGYRYEATQTADGQALVLGFQAPGRARGRQLRVTVDAGHGGSDPGTRSLFGDPEKSVALQLARQLERALVRRGVIVQATRQGDQTLSLHGRVDMGEEFRSDALVSIHLNHAGRASTRGIETYWYTPESVVLARSVQRRLVAALGGPDRGVHRENFVVVKYGRFPACLVEVGYLSNPEEARLLMQPAYQQRAADGMALGILDALGIPAQTAPIQTSGTAGRASGTRAPGRDQRRGRRTR